MLLPFVLVGPLLMLATAIVSLSAHGPLGWLASLALVLAVLLGTWWAVQVARRWWAGTKAPIRPSVPGRAGHRG